MYSTPNMEVISFSVLSVILVNVLGIASYMYYKRYRASLSSQDANQKSLKSEDNKSESRKGKQKKMETKQKAKQKKNPPQQQKKKTPATENLSDTESFTTEEQLAQTIISQHQFSQDSINTTAVNAKPKIKKPTPTQRSNSKSRKGSTNENVIERDPDWENVIGRKHKKKLYPTTKRGDKFEFTLDDEGGIVELPFCEVHFPAESVLKPLHIGVKEENYKKFVDDTEEKVFVTPALHFTKDRETKLYRKFTMKLNTLKMMGRGWDGNVCCQIEMKDSDDSWVTTGRTEYMFGKPIQFVGDDLTSFRAVITRGQNGAITRDLRIAAYIARPKVQNPTYHFVHLCIYDKSQQSQFKVESNMQQFLMKMEPRICNVQFGYDLQFKIQPSKKFTPEDKDVFMRWTEICKAFVNVRFQIRLNRNETEDPTLETDYHTMVFLNISKVSATATTTQEEYFRFYWVAATLYPKKNQKFKGRKVKGQEDKVSEDDGFASGSDALITPEAESAPELGRPIARVTSSKPPIPPKSGASPKKRDNRRIGPKQPQPSQITPKPIGPSKSKATVPQLSLPKPQPTKSGLPPLKASGTVQSTKTKARPRASKKKSASLENDKYTLNILNDLQLVKSQVQSIFPPTVLPGMGIPQTKPQKSSMSEKPVKNQSTTVKSQEFTSNRKTPTSGANPTVNRPRGPLSTSPKNPQKAGGRSPKKSRRSGHQGDSKGRGSNDKRSTTTAKVAEKGSGDKEMNSSSGQEQQKPRIAPSGGDTGLTPESKEVKSSKQARELNGPKFRDQIPSKRVPNDRPNNSSNQPKRQPQKSHQSQERNQQRKNNPIISESNPPSKSKGNPTRPQTSTPKPQNGPMQKPITPEKRKPTPKTANAVKLTNGHVDNVAKLKNGIIGGAGGGKDGIADQAPKERRPRRPRNRNRGPPLDQPPQPRPIKSEAS